MRDYARILGKRRRLIAGFAAAGLALGVFNYLRATHAFSATSRVLIERPNNFVIGTAFSTATSTKQQMQFMKSAPYQSLARSLADLSVKIPLDLRDQSLMDNISKVMVQDVLDSAYVTPARLIRHPETLYQPTALLTASEQEQTVVDAPKLSENLRVLNRMATGTDESLTRDWVRGYTHRSSLGVWENLKDLAGSGLVREMSSLGVTPAAADLRVPPGAERRPDRVIGARLEMAATLVGTLVSLDDEKHADTEKARGKKIEELTTIAEVEDAARQIMTSKYVTGLMKLSGALDWDTLSPTDKYNNIERAREALWVANRRAPQGPDSVWMVRGNESEEGADIIEINQMAADPVTARTASNAMAAVMVWKDRMTKVAEAERSAQFLDQALTTAYKEMTDQENALSRFRKENGYVDLPATLTAAVENAATVESQRNEAEAGIREASARLRELRGELGARDEYAVGRTITQNPVLGSIKTELVTAETELASMEANYQEDYPPLMAKRAAVENLRRRYQEESRQSVAQSFTPDPVKQQLAQGVAELSAQQVGLEARKNALTRLLGEVEGKFKSLPDEQADAVRLLRNLSLAERKYTGIWERLLDAQNNREMRQGNAKVVDLALEPGLHASPRIRNIIFAMILGTFLGCLCALALSSTDTNLRTVDDVQRELGVPVLAHLPSIPSGHTLVVESLPAAAVTEGFRALRSTIRFMGGEKPLRTIAATSTRAAEGKSTVVANLAASLAQAGLTVTAVDADLRRPRLASFFGLQNGNGLSDALAGNGTASAGRQPTRIPGLWVMAAGQTPENPGELLDNGRIGRVLTELSEGNDMLIVDTPPIGVVTDAALVGSAADATMLIIESGTVEPDEARAALSRLKDHARANVIGVVLVGGDAPVSEDYVRYVSVDGPDGNGHRNGGSRRQRRARVNN